MDLVARSTGAGALVLAAGSLALVWFSAPPAPSTPAEVAAAGAECGCEDLQREVERLRAQQAQLAYKLATVSSVVAADPSAGTSARAELTAPERYASLEVEVDGVDVVQTESGSLSVFNSDPELTGEVVMVVATLADGTQRSVPVTVPPPE